MHNFYKYQNFSLQDVFILIWYFLPVLHIRLYYYFFSFISYTYYLIFENIALQASWPTDPTDLLQTNLTP